MITSPDLPLEVLEAENLGQECAEDAVKAAGGTPWDSEGNSLLPQKPQEGDWQALEELHPGEITREEREAFFDAYQRTIRHHRGVRFGEYLRNVRHNLGLTQKEIADEIGVTDNTISRWELGKVIPNRYTEAALVRQLRKFQRQVGKTL